MSKALHLAKENQIKVPVYNEDVERIKELMSFYKFTKKQTTQQKNHLEALSSKNGHKFSIRELEKSIKESKAKELLSNRARMLMVKMPTIDLYNH